MASKQRRSIAKVVQDKEKNYNYCIYDSDIATGLRVGAFLFLTLNQAIVMLSTKCFCCGRGLKPGGAMAWAVILFMIC